MKPQRNKFFQVLEWLDEIALVSSKLDKLDLVKVHLHDKDFRKIVHYALDPFTRFYIKNYEITNNSTIPPVTIIETSEIDSLWYSVLDDLSRRSISGNEARKAVGTLVEKGIVPGELAIRIINKDLKAGFGASTVNKAIPGFIREFPYQRCDLPEHAKFDTWDWKKGVISQEKADGMYCTINKVDDKNTVLMSRSGKPFPNESFTNLILEIERLIPTRHQVQGELLVADKDGNVLPREIGNGMLNKVAQGGDWVDGAYPVYHAWDMIPLEYVKSKVKYNVPYITRLTELQSFLIDNKLNLSNQIQLIETRIVHTKEEANEHFREMLAAGKEGTIMSEPNAPWIDGTSKFKIKRKVTAPCELKVIGYRPGKGKNKELFGSLICESADSQLEVAISGFKDKERKEIFEDIDNVIGQIVTVDSNMIMAPSKDNKKWSLFLPRFNAFRSDRTEADSLTRIQDQFTAATNNL